MENQGNPLFDLIQSLTEKANTNENVQTEPIHTESNSNNSFNITDILKNLNFGGQTATTPNSNSGFDISTMMKMQKIVSSFNNEDPRKNLLISIKPFLRKSRQNKIDEYITYLSIITAIGIFNDKGSEENRK